MMRTFDATVAAWLYWTGCEAVVAYEGAALRTFRAAKRLGVTCILDAANVHHSAQERWISGANSLREIAEKDLEIELADLVLTCSSLARDTYIEAGVAEDKVRAVPLGVDLSLFRAYPASVPRQQGDTAIVFCNAGLLDRRKGMDLIVTACRALKVSGLKFTFLIAGNLGEVDQQYRRSLAELAIVTPRLPQERLPDFYANADVFVLASRFDSFGMVVAEALACGLPVIVTDNVGAKDLVQQGVNGWVIPAGDPQALTEQMKWCARNPAAIRGMRAASRASVERRDWARYRENVAEVILGFLDSARVGR